MEMEMYAYEITITDKSNPKHSECADEFTYYVAGKNPADALRVLWEKYNLEEAFSPYGDSLVIVQLGELCM